MSKRAALLILAALVAAGLGLWASQRTFGPAGQPATAPALPATQAATVLPQPRAVPAFALRAVLGELAGDTLASQRITPGVLQATGFSWDQPDIAAMIEVARRE